MICEECDKRPATRVFTDGRSRKAVCQQCYDVLDYSEWSNAVDKAVIKKSRRTSGWMHGVIIVLMIIAMWLAIAVAETFMK